MKKIYFISVLVFLTAVFSRETSAQPKRKINGVSFVAPPKEIGKNEIIKPKEVINGNFLSIMPYAFISEGSTSLQYNGNHQWWGEREDGTIKTIQLAHAEGYKIMLKPHVWKRYGEYTGKHSYEKESDWKAFEKSFAEYIISYAKVATANKVEIFCIGTEWEQFALRRPNFWYALIKDVRKIYKGQLTYAANWDEYKRVSFWKELDYIGVDAYFPLLDDKTPSINEMKEALNPYKKELKELSKRVNAPILFTEFGYRSRDFTAKKPWESDRAGETNLMAQENAYTSFFKSFWNEPFIAGGFLWKWFSNYDNAGGSAHNGFTPQNKPVESIIKNWYSH